MNPWCLIEIKLLLSLPEQSIKISFCSKFDTKLKEFTGKAQDKSSNLLRALEFNDDTLYLEVDDRVSGNKKY